MNAPDAPDQPDVFETGHFKAGRQTAHSIEQLPACPVCGGRLIDIRQKRQCERCHTICETCCEGGRG